MNQSVILRLLLIPAILSILIIGTFTNTVNASYSTKANQSLTVPVVCDQGEECLPQLFVSIPLNQTKLANMSSTEIANLKVEYLNSIDSYFEESIRTFKQNPSKPLSPMAFCDTLPEPGCYGMKPPDKDRFGLELNVTK